MVAAALPENERYRLERLRSYEILDTEPEEEFDRIVRLAASVLDVPIALISLVDEGRQWFKARVGLDARETPRELAFCAHAIHGMDVYVVHDATQNPLF
jgi:GAF domain-containing protein